MKIFNKLTAWLAVALLSGPGLALADPPSIVGRLNYLSGTVSFAPADASNDWGVAPLNRPVTTGDRLWADRDGRAEMRIGSTAIRIAALTSMDVLRLDDDGTQLRLAQGTLNVHLRKLDKGDSFEISTPDGAVLLTQPGNYRINVDPSGATTTVVVRRGQADVLTGNTPFLVRDNQRASFSAQQQELVSAPAPDEFDNWALARDRQEERIVATRYVPPEMTGYEDLDQHGSWQTASQYGNVWVPTAVPAGWAPYRHGRWVWISPWGWTWVDNAPWGFAPYHYGRWVWMGHRWGWAPGARVARPVYAPALVAFVGGSNWSVSVGSGPAVGWVPLGWREPYIPWYRHSPTYVRNVNVTHVTNVNVIQQYNNVNNTRIRYVNRDAPSGTTVVTRDTFVRARQVNEAPLRVPAQALAAARVTHDAPVSRPERQSLIASRPGARLPAAIETREVVAQRAPASPARLQAEGAAGNERGGAAEHRPRVRVLTAAEQATAPRRAPDAPPAAAEAKGEKRERTAEPSPQATQPKPRAEKPVPQPPAQDERRERAAAPPSAPPKPRVEQNQPPQAAKGERREQRAAEQPTAAAPPKPRVEQPSPPQPTQGQRREQAAEQSPPSAPPAPPKARGIEQASPPVAPRAAAPPPAVDARQRQERQSQQEQQEQQRQVRAQAQQLQQQKQQEQRERQQQIQQQRAQEMQQQRDRQLQQAQQDQQRQARAQAQEAQQQRAQEQRERQQQVQQQRAQEAQQRDRQMQQQQAQQVEQQRQAQRQQAHQAEQRQAQQQAEQQRQAQRQQAQQAERQQKQQQQQREQR